eukprot:895304-Prymnesium_polylepis.1
MNSGCSTTPPSRSVRATTDESGPRPSARSGGRSISGDARDAIWASPKHVRTTSMQRRPVSASGVV